MPARFFGGVRIFFLSGSINATTCSQEGQATALQVNPRADALRPDCTGYVFVVRTCVHRS
jgi:hypothetical protein